MTYFMLLTVNGLVIGLIYALMAAGLTLVFSTTGNPHAHKTSQND